MKPDFTAFSLSYQCSIISFSKFRLREIRRSYIYNLCFNPRQLGTVHASVVCNIWYAWLKCVSHDSLFAVLNTVSRGSLSRYIREMQVANFRILLQRALYHLSRGYFVAASVCLFHSRASQARSINQFLDSVSRCCACIFDDTTPPSDRWERVSTFVDTIRIKQWRASVHFLLLVPTSGIVLGRDSV